MLLQSPPHGRAFPLTRALRCFLHFQSDHRVSAHIRHIPGISDDLARRAEPLLPCPVWFVSVVIPASYGQLSHLCRKFRFTRLVLTSQLCLVHCPEWRFVLHPVVGQEVRPEEAPMRHRGGCPSVGYGQGERARG